MTQSGIDQPSSADHLYNPIFGILVDETEDELVGLIAYSLYKRSKRHWVADFKSRHGGAKPTDKDLQEYIAYWTPDRINGLRAEARGALVGFGETVIADARPRIMRETIRGTFWKNVLSSALAGFLYTLFLIGVAVVLAAAGVDLIGIFGSIASPGSA